MSEKKQEVTPDMIAEFVVNAIKLEFGDRFIKLQEQVIHIGNHVLKLQKRVDELETRPSFRVVK